MAQRFGKLGQNLSGDLPFALARYSYRGPLPGEDNHLVVIAGKTDVVPRDIVANDEVSLLGGQFPRTLLPEIPSFGRKPHQNLMFK